jgi:hypothetical protein
MRAWPILGVAFVTVGCFSNLVSLAPLSSKGQEVALPGIVGEWVDEGEKPTVLRFEGDDGAYRMFVAEDGKEGRGSFEVTFTTIGDALYWDLLAERPDTEDQDSLWEAHRLPVHGFARVALDGDRLELAFLDPDWVKSAVKDGRSDVALTESDDSLVLTGSTDELRRFIEDCAREEGAFGEPTVFTRRVPG